MTRKTLLTTLLASALALVLPKRAEAVPVASAVTESEEKSKILDSYTEGSLSGVQDSVLLRVRRNTPQWEVVDSIELEDAYRAAQEAEALRRHMETVYPSKPIQYRIVEWDGS